MKASRVPAGVLDRYTAAHGGLTLEPVGGGFSGAEVFRCDDYAGRPVFALKAWPPGFPAERLEQIHAWVTQAARLPFVPSILPTDDGRSLALGAGRLWDVSRWMPGKPTATATVTEVEAACAAAARLHAQWPVERCGPVPGVASRLRALSDFRNFFPAAPSVSPTLDPLLSRAWCCLKETLPAAEGALRRWESVARPLQPCVRDLRGEHVLFTAGTVTGIVDYGATALDHPAVDLARLLGDLAGEDDERFDAGLRAYGAAGGELGAPDELVRVLDRCGVIGSVIGWFVRLGGGRGCHPNEAAVAARLGHLLARLEHFRIG